MITFVGGDSRSLAAVMPLVQTIWLLALGTLHVLSDQLHIKGVPIELESSQILCSSYVNEVSAHHGHVTRSFSLLPG